MILRSATGIVALVSAVVVGHALPAAAWRTVFDGGSPMTDWAADAWSVDVDGSGRVIASGSTDLQDSDAFTVALELADGAPIWTSYQPQLQGAGLGMVLDSSDDILVKAFHNTAPLGPIVLHVSKISSAGGSLVWSYEAPTPMSSFTYPERLFVSPAGDAFSCGSMDPIGQSPMEFSGVLAVRLDGGDGSETWRRELYAVDHPIDVNCALSPAGDALYLGYDDGTDIRIDLLDVATGASSWTVPGYGIDAMAVDAAGDVVAAGFDGTVATVAKLDGSTGAEIWSTPLAGIDPDTWTVALDAAGDVYVGGDGGAADLAIVSRFSGATGALLWSRELGGFAETEFDRVVDVEPLGLDVVYAAAVVRDPDDGDERGLLVAIDSATGAEIWSHVVAGTTAGDQSASIHDLALSPAGDPLIAGSSVQVGLLRDFLVARVSGQTPGRKLSVTDSAADAARRKLSFLSRSIDLIAPTPGGPADPTVTGATLTLYNPSTTETAVMNLPAAHWQADVSSSGFRGYRYRDSELADGPCKSVSWRVGKQLKLACRGAGIGFTLDEASQGSLAVVLETPGLRMCSVFGGTIRRDVSTASGSGSFVAQKSSETDACPLP